MLAIRVSLSSIDKVLGDGYSVEMQVARETLGKVRDKLKNSTD